MTTAEVNLFTDGTTEEILEALPTLSVPAVSSVELCHKRVVVVGGSIGGLAAAACLRAAGFQNVQVLERSTGHRDGAGIGLDDASVAILKGLGLQLGSHKDAVEEGDDERKAEKRRRSRAISENERSRRTSSTCRAH